MCNLVKACNTYKFLDSESAKVTEYRQLVSLCILAVVLFKFMDCYIHANDLKRINKVTKKETQTDIIIFGSECADPCFFTTLYCKISSYITKKPISSYSLVN